MKERQQASRVFMVEPTYFGYNSQTAHSNAFQKKTTLAPEQIQEQALAEFRNFVAQLKEVGIEVYALKSSAKTPLPDAVFPNNWISLHANGTLVLYPMLTENRRAERDPEIIAYLESKLAIQQIKDFTAAEDVNAIVEGTGSIVFDHIHKIAYACLSERTEQALFEEICRFLNYRAIAFTALDVAGKAIYHTNVMMSVAEDYALVCLESIPSQKERDLLKQTLTATKKEIISISLEQVNAFAGNALELRNLEGKRYLVVSRTAFNALTTHQKKIIERSAQLLPIDISTIETIGGGSVRCMLAEIFCPIKNEKITLELL